MFRRSGHRFVDKNMRPLYLIAVGALGARMDLAQRDELRRGRRRRLRDLVGVTHLPTGLAFDLLARHARMDRHYGHFLGPRVRLEYAQVGDELGGALGLHAEARAVVAALAMAERG